MPPANGQPRRVPDGSQAATIGSPGFTKMCADFC
jgi:hypothetical protein